ncbi:hypothetical protein SAMD00023518_00494 [Listeria monocytogenes]|nr:hypothetical protein SAMD00023518_00494 [Listeria monocytogenes]
MIAATTEQSRKVRTAIPSVCRQTVLIFSGNFFSKLSSSIALLLFSFILR